MLKMSRFYPNPCLNIVQNSNSTTCHNHPCYSAIPSLSNLDSTNFSESSINKLNKWLMKNRGKFKLELELFYGRILHLSTSSWKNIAKKSIKSSIWVTYVQISGETGGFAQFRKQKLDVKRKKRRTQSSMPEFVRL